MSFPPNMWVGRRGKHCSLTLLSSEIWELKVEDEREGDGGRACSPFWAMLSWGFGCCP